MITMKGTRLYKEENISDSLSLPFRCLHSREEEDTGWRLHGCKAAIMLEPYAGGHANYNWTKRERIEGNSRKRKSHFPSILGVEKVFFVR